MTATTTTTTTTCEDVFHDLHDILRDKGHEPHQKLEQNDPERPPVDAQAVSLRRILPHDLRRDVLRRAAKRVGE